MFSMFRNTAFAVKARMRLPFEARRHGIVRLVPFIAAFCVGVVIVLPTWAGIIQYDFSSNATINEVR